MPANDAGRPRGARRRGAAAVVGLTVVLVTALVLGPGAEGGGVPARAQTRVATASGPQDQGASTVVWSGRRSTDRVDAAYGGSLVVLAGKASATFSFRGTGAAWVARTGPFDGRADVYLDGRRARRVDLYAPTKRYQQVAYRVTGLAAGTHTLRVVRTGTKDRRSKGRNVTVDAFQLLDDRPPTPPGGVDVRADGTSASIRWDPSPDSDVVGYRVLRSSGAAGSSVVVGSTGPGGRALVDVGLPAAVPHTYRVVAVDSSGNVSGSSAAVSLTLPVPAASALPRYADCPAPTVTVVDAGQLAAALGRATPGTSIRLLPGRYDGQVKVSVRGTPDAPVWVCGPRTAVLDGGGITKNGGLRIAGSAHLVVAGLTVRSSAKGVSVLGSSSVVLADLHVTDIGQEGVHLKEQTTGSVVVGTVVERTGLDVPGYGEGIYVGTDRNNWCALTACDPDRSDDNVIEDNTVAQTGAEPVEVKEGTVGGVVADNRIDGAGSDVGRLIALKGSGWTVSGNRGTGSDLDGVQVLARSGYGTGNVVYGNTFTGRLPGYGVRVPADDSTTVVGCDNRVPPGARAVSNVGCQP